MQIYFIDSINLNQLILFNDFLVIKITHISCSVGVSGHVIQKNAVFRSQVELIEREFIDVSFGFAHSYHTGFDHLND